MEVDVLSPQPRMYTSSNKRSRSPDSLIPSERATKRHMATAYSDPGLLTRLETARLFEDDVREWEYRARDMSLQSPVLTPSASASESGTDCGTSECGSRQDIQMEGLEEMPDPTFCCNEASEPRTPCHHSSRNADAERTPQAISSFVQGVFAHSTSVPNITFQPATPSEGHSVSPQPFATSSSRSESIPSSPTSMSLDPLSSPSQSWKHHPQKRRALISMGPRAGCVKCEKKVPGHWMHVD